MQSAVQQFCIEAERIIGQDSPFVRSITSQKPPDIIYHYTNETGLKGILESGKLWLTEIGGLNDPSELKHGFDVAIKTLKKMVASGPPESRIFARDLELIAKRGTIQKAADFFICSFSLCSDDLGQWRAYADNGRGFALGFDAAALESRANLDSFPLTYDDDKLAEIDREIVAKVLHLARLPDYKDDLSIAFMTYVTNAAIYFKHPAYKFEKEYRFLEVFSFDDMPPVRERVRGNELVRYRELDWGRVAPDAFKEIVIGPANLKGASSFAHGCLGQYCGSVRIIPSSVPYRAL